MSWHEEILKAVLFLSFLFLFVVVVVLFVCLFFFLCVLSLRNLFLHSALYHCLLGWLYFTVRGYVLSNHGRLKTGSVLYTDIWAVNPPQKITLPLQGPSHYWFLEQGQNRMLTLYHKCLVDKLKPRLYTVWPDSTWHLTAFHLQEYLTWSSSFCLSNKLDQAGGCGLSLIWHDIVLCVCQNMCVCSHLYVQVHLFSLSEPTLSDSKDNWC